MAQVISFGELLVDMVSPADSTLGDATNYLKAPGGAPANVAVGLQKLDVPSHPKPRKSVKYGRAGTVKFVLASNTV